MSSTGKLSAKSRKTRTRTPKQKDEPPLENSWVVDDGAESSFDDDSGILTDREDDETVVAPFSGTRRKPEARIHIGTAESVIMPGRRSSEVEFRMPMLDHNPSVSEPRQRRPAARRPGRPKKESPKQAFSKAPDLTFDAGRMALAYVTQILSYCMDILGMVLRGLKAPIALILMLWVVGAVLTTMVNRVTNGAYNMLSPVCDFPGASFLNLPFCEYDAVSEYGSEPPPPEFERLMQSQAKFEEILAGSTVGVTLPADMKRSEAAIRDLRTLVRYSSLRSRNELGLEFEGFIETARMAAADLQKFNSHTGRAADSIISTAKWTMRTLDDVNEYQASRGAIESFVSDTLLAPFQPRKLTPALLLESYVSHTRKVEEEMIRLLEEAQALLMILQNLEDRLDTIHDISVRDGQVANVAKDELLGKLWTILGGNKNEIRKYNTQLKLLQEVGDYRQTAWAHVSTTILKLQAMNSELEELRERVGSTELLMDRKDVPLSVHLEAIQMGVERLEIGRRSMKEAQAEYYDRAMHRDRLDINAGPGGSNRGRLIES